MFKSKYVRNILTLVSSALFAQILALLLTPILTRLYSPEEFGVFTAFISYSGTLAAFIFLSLELAIVKSKSSRELSSVLGLMLVVSIFLLSILSITIYSESAFYTLIGFDKLFDIKVLVLLGVLFSATNLVLNQFITRKEQFSVYATSQVSFVALRFVFSYLFFYFGFTQYGLVFGFTLATILIIIYLAYRAEIHKERLSLKMRSTLVAFRKHSDLIFFNTPASLINTILISFPVFFIFKLYGLEAAGFFGLAFRMVQLPITLVNKAMGQVMYKRFIDLRGKPKDIRAFVFKNILVLSSSFPCFIAVYIFGRDIFSFIFGNGWGRAGDMASLMSPYIFFSFVISPITYYFIAYKKTKQFLTISSLALIALILMTFFIEMKSVDDFVMNYSILNIGFCVLVLVYVVGSVSLSAARAENVDNKNS